jgi:plastocyanin
MLDILARHADQVVPGSVQAFDMEVIRDTKDTSFRFGLGAATTVFGSLAAMGLMLGAGLTLFESEGEATSGETTPPPAADPYTQVATDNKFARSTLQAPPNADVTFTLDNNGKTIHNLSFYQSQNGQLIAEGPQARGGATAETKFTSPGEGNYFFQCDFHPTEMTGALQVTASAPPPGGAAAAAASPTAAP